MKDVNCTWEGCELNALHSELDSQGKVWATLCQFGSVLI